MPRSKYQEAKERRRLRAAAEHEKDMVYYVLFQRKEWKQGDPESTRYFPRVDVPLDASRHPEMIQHAIQQFQLTHKVSDWREVASGYTPGGHWYG